MNDKVNRKVLKASLICAAVLIGCLALLGVFELCVKGLENRLTFLDAGKRWSASGERYAVITLYCEKEAGVAADQVGQWAYSMDAALLQSSVTPSENGRSWAYCYGTETAVTAVGPKGSASAETLAVGGDFFVFHPLSFPFGSPFLNDNTNPNGVVLDRNLAWKLFGAENVVGMEMTINDVDFTVVGITGPESGNRVYKTTYGDSPRMYMSFAGYEKVMGAGCPVTLFEAALPNAVKSFALGIFNSAVSVSEEAAVVTEATDRFSLTNRFRNMQSLSYSWIRPNTIELPYWENEARVCDYRAAVMMIFEVALAAVGGASLLLSIILLRFSGYSLIDTVKNTAGKLGGKKKTKRNRRH